MVGSRFFTPFGQKPGQKSGSLSAKPAKLQSFGMAAVGLPIGALRALSPVTAARSGQKVKRLHCCIGVNVTPKHLANAVGIGARFLNNIGERRALLPHDVGRDGLNICQRLALDGDVIQFDTCYRVLRNCHGSSFLMACAAKGGFEVPKVAVGRVLQRRGGTGRVGDSQSLARRNPFETLGRVRSRCFGRFNHKIVADRLDMVCARPGLARAA